MVASESDNESIPDIPGTTVAQDMEGGVENLNESLRESETRVKEHETLPHKCLAGIPHLLSGIIC